MASNDEILQALAVVQQQLKNLQSDVRVATHANEQRIQSVQNEIVGLRADLAGVMATGKENKKKSFASSGIFSNWRTDSTLLQRR